MNPTRVERNERGIALVMAMLILMVMSLLGLVLMAGASLNRGLAGNDQRMRESLNLAEAGVGEALARIKNQETLMSANDPDDVCQVFNTLPGSVPVLGADSIGLATGQPLGGYLDYTTPERSADALTIAWKKNAAGTAVMKYDPTKNPKIQELTGSPIYVVTATGRVNNARRTVVTEVIAKPYQVNAKGTLVADVPIGALGNAAICGYDHSMDTPYDDGKDGRNLDMPSPDPDHCLDNEKVGGTNVPGLWSTGPITPGGAAQPNGNPAIAAGQPDFYTGPWDMFTMSQAEFWSFMGAPVPFAGKTDWNGVFYVDGNTVTQDGSEDMAVHSVNGEGFLYVDGDLSVNAGFHYKGLIYVEGDFKINGNCWILGAIVVNGQTEITANGGMTLLFSKDAIETMLTKYGGQFVTLSWREK
jgi:Tfp pilus assembly protein PilX